MTTASTNTVISHTSDAEFQAWVNEIYSNLVTNCGLTQTADTGQMAVPCTTLRPGTSTIGGYYVFRFNDTLQATSAVFIKMEFGTGTNANIPRCFITVGTSTNGAGTVTGTTLTRCSVFFGTAPFSNVTNYVSRYCYNATQGYLGMSFKIGAGNGSNSNLGGFYMFRSVDNTGAPTATAMHLLTNSLTTGETNSQGQLQVLNYVNSVNQTLSSTTLFTFAPHYATSVGGQSTLVGGNVTVFPFFQIATTASTQGIGITNALALVVLADIAVNATFSSTIIGATSLTYINVGNSPFGSSGNGITTNAYGGALFGMAMLWQ